MPIPAKKQKKQKLTPESRARKAGLARAQVLAPTRRKAIARLGGLQRARIQRAKQSYYQELAQSFLQELCGLYFDEFAKAPELLPNLINPLTSLADRIGGKPIEKENSCRPN